MEAQSKTTKYNTQFLLKRLAGKHVDIDISHITYNPDIIPDYHVISGQKHDGLIAFTNEMIDKALLRLINQNTYCKNDSVDFSRLTKVNYEVGEMELISVYDRYTLRKGQDSEVTINGVDETLKIPVKCSYEYSPTVLDDPSFIKVT